MATAHESAHTAAGRAPGELDVELLGRRGCHLCDEAKAALGRIAQAVPLRLHETDVDGDFALRERYGLLVPVVLIYQAWTYWVFRHRLSAEGFGDVKSPIDLLEKKKEAAGGSGSEDQGTGGEPAGS